MAVEQKTDGQAVHRPCFREPELIHHCPDYIEVFEQLPVLGGNMSEIGR